LRADGPRIELRDDPHLIHRLGIELRDHHLLHEVQFRSADYCLTGAHIFPLYFLLSQLFLY
jgi:hypothetical protein